MCMIGIRKSEWGKKADSSDRLFSRQEGDFGETGRKGLES